MTEMQKRVLTTTVFWMFTVLAVDSYFISGVFGYFGDFGKSMSFLSAAISFTGVSVAIYFALRESKKRD